VYSEKAMAHLKRISTVVFISVDIPVIQKRIHNFATRGIAKAADQSFEALFEERRLLYEQYADLTVDGNVLDQETLAGRIGQFFTESAQGKA